MLESYGDITGDVPHYTVTGGLPGYYLPINGNRSGILFGLYKPFVRPRATSISPWPRSRTSSYEV